MKYIYYPSEAEAVNALENGSPMLMLVSFDGKEIIIGEVDLAMEHHILLAKIDRKSVDIDKYFRIVFDKEGADWTFTCPPDYKSISDKDKRISQYYKDGFITIAEALQSIGYLIGISIPKRYQRHLKNFSRD